MKVFQDLLDRLLTAPGEAPGGALATRTDSTKPVQSATRTGGKLTPTGNAGKRVSTTAPLTVFLLLDVSQSMDEGKLRQAKDGGFSFAEDAIRKGYQVGVIQFTSWARVRTKPTTKLAAIRAGLSEPLLQATTNMAAAIELATRELRGAKGTRAMVLVTDGYPDNSASALAAAKEAKQRDITIIAIGTDDADRDFLKELATASELATTVPDRDLGVTIAKAAGLLPAKTSGTK